MDWRGVPFGHSLHYLFTAFIHISFPGFDLYLRRNANIRPDPRGRPFP